MSYHVTKKSWPHHFQNFPYMPVLTHCIQELSVSEEVEKIREKLQSEDMRIDDVISDISFSLNEKSSTISQLQNVIDDLKDRQSGGVDPHEFVSLQPF